MRLIQLYSCHAVDAVVEACSFLRNALNFLPNTLVGAGCVEYDDIAVVGCNNRPMSPEPSNRLRLATSDDAAFVVEMARHPCVVFDWPLPDADSDEVLSLLPPRGEVPIIANDTGGDQLGAVWTFLNDPPLRTDAAGVALPELCIAVAPGHRGRGVGGALLDALFAHRTGTFATMCTNVHVRNPAQHLYQRKGFRVVGHGRGPLGVAMLKDLGSEVVPGPAGG
jgi:GNAT superfamily N-acetyltransferase